MQPDPRAIVFDLDDTLYPYRAFVRSGFRAVARDVAQQFGLSQGGVYRLLCRASKNGSRGRELQALCAAHALPQSLIPRLISRIHNHVPALRIPLESTRVLRALRGGWRIGILTNGEPAIQRRKVAALGVGALVDAVVYATECGTGAGKPSSDAFEAVLDRLGTVPASTVYVGDDPYADMGGAAAAGMHTIHLVAHGEPRVACERGRGHAHVARLGQVPAIASWLVPEEMERHVG